MSTYSRGQVYLLARAGPLSSSGLLSSSYRQVPLGRQAGRHAESQTACSQGKQRRRGRVKIRQSQVSLGSDQGIDINNPRGGPEAESSEDLSLASALGDPLREVKKHGW